MTHFPALRLANFFILIAWDILEKVALTYYNSAIWRKKPCDNYPITVYLTQYNAASQPTKFIHKIALTPHK